MAQINKVRLPDGRVVRPTEWTSTPYWSTVEIATGAIADLAAFSYGRGGTVPGSIGPRRANLEDTNLKGDGGVIQENAELLLFSIMVELFQVVQDEALYAAAADPGAPQIPEVSAQNVARFQRDTLLRLIIANRKPFLLHPVGLFPAAMGIKPISGAALGVDGATPTIAGQNGGVNSHNNRRLATPHRILPGEVFDITLVFPDGGINDLNFGNDPDARLRARIYAAGYRKRPVA